jgi:thiol-disulfide isomerase/thioredoxin
MSVRRGLAAAAALLLLLSACTSDAAGLRSGNGQGFVSSDGSAQVLAPADRPSMPDISGTTLEGDSLALSDLAGDVVVLNLWASWCAPCRAEAPVLQEVYDDQRNDGVSFVGINTRDDEAAAIAFQENFDITYPSLDDEGGEIELLVADVVPLAGIPWTVVVDRQGRVAARILGEVGYSQLSGLVADVAAES